MVRKTRPSYAEPFASATRRVTQPEPDWLQVAALERACAISLDGFFAGEYVHHFYRMD